MFMAENRYLDIYREYVLSVPNPRFCCQKNKHKHRNLSSNGNLHRREWFPHQTSFIRYKYLIICTKCWVTKDFTCNFYIMCRSLYVKRPMYLHIYKWTWFAIWNIFAFSPFSWIFKIKIKKKKKEEEILTQFVEIFLALNTYHSSNFINKTLVPLNFPAGSLPRSLF